MYSLKYNYYYRPTAQDVLRHFENMIGKFEDLYTAMQDACKLDLIQLATKSNEKKTINPSITQRVKDRMVRKYCKP